jgi:hypothetical protein
VWAAGFVYLVAVLFYYALRLDRDARAAEPPL